MSIKSFVKSHKILSIFLIIILILVVLCVGGTIAIIVIFSNKPSEAKYDDAIRVAKNDFGFEKILWVEHTNHTSLGTTEEYPDGYTPFRYAYYVVGEKDGEELCLIVPSYFKEENSFILTWSLNYSFTQIVEKFNEQGANYVPDVPNDIYSTSFSNYISITENDHILNSFDNYRLNKLGIDNYDDFYERLDVKAVFEYTWYDDDNARHYCIVTQENGELKSYEWI